MIECWLAKPRSFWGENCHEQVSGVRTDLVRKPAAILLLRAPVTSQT